MDLYQQIFFTTLAISFGMLHSILFIYNPRSKSNLFFAIFLILNALNIFFDFQATLSTAWEEKLFYLRMHRGVMPYNSLFALLFTYYAFELKIPKHFWLIVTLIVITGFFSVIEPIENFDYLQFALILMPLEAVRILVSAIKGKKIDAWIITAGFILLFLFSAFDTLLDFNLMLPINNITNGYPFGFVCLILSTSIYLARDFARSSQKIIDQEKQNKEMEISKRLLEAEDKRKTKELNDARNLQLSLLPQCITDIKNYDFCFDMQPASEVGGDYYDYTISENGEISLVIGDATDHGMKAGMMVSIVKSLFLSNVDNTEITEFLNSSSKTIKQMKLNNLYMALMLIKINDHQLTISSAGIPPLLIYRKKTNTVEEYKIKGMPLGALNEFPYQTITTELNVGDTVLLMSDGLPELFNKDKKSFGYKRLNEIFLQNANEPVTDIVNTLFLAGEEWRDGYKQSDDITFVAFRRTDEFVN